MITLIITKDSNVRGVRIQSDHRERVRGNAAEEHGADPGKSWPQEDTGGDDQAQQLAQ